MCVCNIYCWGDDDDDDIVDDFLWISLERLLWSVNKLFLTSFKLLIDMKWRHDVKLGHNWMILLCVIDIKLFFWEKMCQRRFEGRFWSKISVLERFCTLGGHFECNWRKKNPGTATSDNNTHHSSHLNEVREQSHRKHVIHTYLH